MPICIYNIFHIIYLFVIFFQEKHLDWVLFLSLPYHCVSLCITVWTPEVYSGILPHLCGAERLGLMQGLMT